MLADTGSFQVTQYLQKSYLSALNSTKRQQKQNAIKIHLVNAEGLSLGMLLGKYFYLKSNCRADVCAARPRAGGAALSTLHRAGLGCFPHPCQHPLGVHSSAPSSASMSIRINSDSHLFYLYSLLFVASSWAFVLSVPLFPATKMDVESFANGTVQQMVVQFMLY